MLKEGMCVFCVGNKNSSENIGKQVKSEFQKLIFVYLAKTLIKTSKINEIKLPSKRFEH